MTSTASPLPIDGCRLVDLEVMGDERGSLIALERATGLPFDIARAYFIFGTKPDVDRGFHAHRALTQWAICVSGHCRFRLEAGGISADVCLDRPDVALEIGPMTWREMRDFSPDCVLLVLADRPYEPDDYIRDIDAFRADQRLDR